MGRWVGLESEIPSNVTGGRLTSASHFSNASTSSSALHVFTSHSATKRQKNLCSIFQCSWSILLRGNSLFHYAHTNFD